MFSFRAKVTVLAIATVCITLLCSSLYVQYVMADYLRKDAFQAQKTAAQAIAMHVDDFVGAHAGVIAVAATLPQVRDTVDFSKASEQHRGVPSEAGLRQRLYFREILRVHPEFNNIILYSPDAARPLISEPVSHQLGTPLQNYREGFAGRDWFRGVSGRDAREIYISEAYVSAQGQLLTAIATRVHDDENRVVAILAGNLRLDRLNEYIQAFSYGKNVRTYLVDKAGNVLAHPDKSLLRAASLTNLKDRETVREAFQNPQATESAAILTEAASGATIYSSYVKLSRMGWVVITEQPEADVMERTRQLREGIAIVAVLLSLAAILAIAFLIRTVTRPLYQVVDHLLSLGGGDFSPRLDPDLRERDDEIGQVAHAVDVMQRNRQSAEQELDASHEELRALYDDLEIAETKLRIQYEELQREIAERAKVDQALAESERQYLMVIEQSPEAVLFFDPETGKMVKGNAQFVSQFGYDPERETNLTIFDVAVDSKENLQAILAAIRRTGMLPLQRRMFRHRNGMLLHVERSGILIRYRGQNLGAIYIQDVSETVRREQEIQRDAQMATRVQHEMLSVPQSNEFLEVQTVFQPYRYVGGDLYFLDWRYRGQVLRGFLVDAAGHGLATALHTSAIHVLLREVNEFDLPLAEQIRWLNRRLGQYFNEEAFVGVIAFEADLQTREMRWVCAGIPGFWAATPSVKGCVTRPGMFLGMRTDENFETHRMPIDVGDCLYFMTDGLTDRIDRCEELPVDDFAETLGRIRKLAEAKDQRDDATAVCIRIQALPDAMHRQQGWPRTLVFNGYGDYRRFRDAVTAILAEVTGLQHSMQEVAVNEALANALECRDGIPRPHEARLRFNRFGKWFVVRVKTSRMGFAGSALLRRLRIHPEEMFLYGEDSGMGRGIPIMLSVTDRMLYNSEGTEALLAWRIQAATIASPRESGGV